MGLYEEKWAELIAMKQAYLDAITNLPAPDVEGWSTPAERLKITAQDIVAACKAKRAKPGLEAFANKVRWQKEARLLGEGMSREAVMIALMKDGCGPDLAADIVGATSPERGIAKRAWELMLNPETYGEYKRSLRDIGLTEEDLAEIRKATGGDD